jgi:AbrB family looped-hinge helix DNA binding protein
MRVTEKGQVTIPKNIRTSLGIETGSEIEFVLKDGDAVIRRVEPAQDEHERNVQDFVDHLRRHKDTMSLGNMDGDAFYRMLRD